MQPDGVGMAGALVKVVDVLRDHRQRPGLPALWAQWAKVASKPFTVAPEQIDANRDAWLRDWTDLAAR